MKSPSEDLHTKVDACLKTLFESKDLKQFAIELYRGHGIFYMENVPEPIDKYMLEQGLIGVSREVRYLTALGISISESGGWLEYLKRLQQEKEKQEIIAQIEHDKLKHDLRISKFQAQTQWWPLIISIISLLVSIVALWAVFSQYFNK